jgi:hypothetical protein
MVPWLSMTRSFSTTPMNRTDIKTISVRFDAISFATAKYHAVRQGKGHMVPYWAIVLPSAALASVPWIRWSKRFSLRTLLIATTLVAVVLGVVVWAV